MNKKTKKWSYIKAYNRSWFPEVIIDLVIISTVLGLVAGFFCSLITYPNIFIPLYLGLFLVIGIIDFIKGGYG